MSKYQSWTTESLRKHLTELERQLETIEEDVSEIRGEIWQRDLNEWSEKYGIRTGDKVVRTTAFHEWWKRRDPISYQSYQFDQRYPVGTTTSVTSINAEYSVLNIHWGPNEVPLEVVKEMRQAYLEMEEKDV